MADVANRLQNLVATQLVVRPEHLHETAHFANDLGADSLDFTNLFVAVEKDFSISIPPADAGDIHTFGDLIKAVQKLTGLP